MPSPPIPPSRHRGFQKVAWYLFVFVASELLCAAYCATALLGQSKQLGYSGDSEPLSMQQAAESSSSDSLSSAEQKAEEARFEKRIRPTLIQYCIECHGQSKQEGGLRLDSRQAILVGGDSGPAVSPGASQDSLILSALRHEGLEMPPNKKLEDRLIAEFDQWVARGAIWSTEDHELHSGPRTISSEDRQWWAYQPLNPSVPPNLDEDMWSRNEIDSFVFADLRARGITPAPPSDQYTLVRRLYLHLVGVPPTPAEIEQFTTDSSDDAYERLVDHLLNDPRFGEHWARFWLDLVRYSESDGWNQDAYRPQIYHYRDYIVSAWNKNIPYADFIRYQLAGDELPDEDPEGLIAAGFLRLGIYEYNQRDAKSHWHDIVNELTDVIGDSFLGLSLSCARCHDHKFDAILQADYFSLRAFLEPIVWRDDLTASKESERNSYREKLALWESQTEPIRSKISQLLTPYETKKWNSTVDKFPLDIQACFNKPRSDRNSWEEQMSYLISRQYLDEGGGPYSEMTKEDKKLHAAYLAELEQYSVAKPAPLTSVMTVTDFEGTIAPTRFLYQGAEQLAAPDFPSVLPVLNLDTHHPIRSGTTGRRTALAQWIGHPRNALTYRVIVNRIWQQLFGRGIVPTSSDFGSQGERPTNPELLDWLTEHFIQEGGRFKPLCKKIVMSSSWRQSALHPNADAHQQLDPSGRFLWRFPVKRLSAEQIRDAMLSASGELQQFIGGPSVEESEKRRSLYLKSSRNNSSGFLHSFDMANGLQSVGKRDTTTTPLQALTLLNSRFVLDRSKNMASRIAAESCLVDKVIDEAFLLTWGHPPDSNQRQQVYDFLDVSPEEFDQPIDIVQLEDLCHMLLNSNPFLYVD